MSWLRAFGWAMAGSIVMGVSLRACLQRQPTACEVYVQRCADFKRQGGPLQGLLFCAETIGGLADIDPDTAGPLCHALCFVLDRAPVVGWERAIEDGGFTGRHL